jgi:hypothetical protein
MRTTLQTETRRLARKLGRSKQLGKVPNRREARKLLEAEEQAEREAALDAAAGRLIAEAGAFQREQEQLRN